MSTVSQRVATAQIRIPLLRQAVLHKPELLFDLAESLFEAGETAEALATYRRVRPRYKTARLPSLKFARALADAGAADTPALAALLNGYAAEGNAAETRRLADGRFLRVNQPAIPDGYTTDRFHFELAEIVRSDLMYFESPSDIAARRTWRNERLKKCEHPAWLAFLNLIRSEVDRYARELPADPAHPFIASRPKRFSLIGFAVVAGSDSYEQYHIHPGGWITSVYYVVEPAVARTPGSTTGWLKIGPEASMVVEGWETHLVAPSPGTLVLMPGYFHHATKPMGVDQERICIVLDVVPLRED